jgi:hypothetical protein
MWSRYYDAFHFIVFPKFVESGRGAAFVFFLEGIPVFLSPGISVDDFRLPASCSRVHQSHPPGSKSEQTEADLLVWHEILPEMKRG